MAGEQVRGAGDGPGRVPGLHPGSAERGGRERGEGRGAAGDPGCLPEDSLEEVRLEIVTKWIDFQNSIPRESAPKDEVQALTSMIEKQAQIVVKTRDMSEEEQQRKATLLAQYANVTDEEDEDEEDEMIGASAINPDKSLFKNTNLEDVMNARKLERDSMRDAGQKKKEQDKQQRENQKASKQERKDKEKKRTQKGERKR
ncbi:MGC81882 protein isoform X1 [Xenopus laevis]|uniref:MGC81882 protein isoform X1 n=1 Tax=Xenopus laevis TaxID=8355 RepID=A0A8J0TZ45_XENLA|nr:MGC81882 protein isoform X1 [Xenopus laevis]